MSEFEERINSLLNNPEELSRLSNMARSLMEGGLFSGGQEQSSRSSQSAPAGPDPMLQKLMSGIAGLGGEKNSNTAMLKAISPYLDEKRGRKLERAIRMAQMARVARSVLREYGGDGLGDQ